MEPPKPDSYRDVCRLLISRIMAHIPANSSQEHLAKLIDHCMPQYRSERSIEAWALEKAIALNEWNAQLPILRPGLPVPCSGGALVSKSISDARPIPLPFQSFEQQSFL